MADILHATGFKRVLDLFATGKVADATTLLKGLQDEYIALCEENKIIKQQLAEVADVLNLAENIDFDGRKYWLNEGNERKGPFCQLCYDRDGLLIHLQPHGQHWECQSCKSVFMTTSIKNEPKSKQTEKNTAIPPLIWGNELG